MFPAVGGSGKSQEGFLVLALLLDLQSRDGETQVSCPVTHWLLGKVVTI